MTTLSREGFGFLRQTETHFCSPNVISWRSKPRTWPMKKRYYQSITCEWLKPRMVILTPPLNLLHCNTMYYSVRGFAQQAQCYKSWSKFCTNWKRHCSTCVFGKNRSYRPLLSPVAELQGLESLLPLLLKTWQRPSVWIIERSDNWSSNNQEPTVLRRESNLPLWKVNFQTKNIPASFKICVLCHSELCECSWFNY